MMELEDDLFAGLGFVQYQIQLGEPERNLQQIARALESVDGLDRSLVVLPELWASGFAYDRFDAMAAETPAMLEELAALAGRHNCIFAGSLPERAEENQGELFYNTLYVSGADGVLGCYRKQQVFYYGGEGRAFISGIEPYLVTTPLGRIGCLVCYDLRFPELARLQCQQGADLLLCSAEWPQARIDHWRAMLKVRALENQTFVVAGNGWGMVDGVNLGGCSTVIDPRGQVLAEAGDGPQAVVVRPDWSTREEYRSRFHSFAIASYPFNDAGKILPSAASCLDLLAVRWRVGQRLVCREVAGPVDTAMLQSLEEARRQGDFLVVAVTAGAQGDSDQRLLAALGCVDAVCRLDTFTAAERARLVKLTGGIKAIR
ncbi:MAG: nitrilase-related carbon-nitrogen hydrolase [Desulfoprunum sp.]|uniref:nitrilase-related carbon-nitrogen hydrolase n=1 Tax=Desulfoprunum sp. TaxID=2020866 RepID=UPI003C776AEE